MYLLHLLFIGLSLLPTKEGYFFASENSWMGMRRKPANSIRDGIFKTIWMLFRGTWVLLLDSCFLAVPHLWFYIIWHWELVARSFPLEIKWAFVTWSHSKNVITSFSTGMHRSKTTNSVTFGSLNWYMLFSCVNKHNCGEVSVQISCRNCLMSVAWDKYCPCSDPPSHSNV